MIRVSIHTSPNATDLAASRGHIPPRETFGIDSAAKALQESGLDVRIVEGPVSEAPDSDFWFVLADDVQEQREALRRVAAEATDRFVILLPGRDRVFNMLEELNAAAAVEALGSEWVQPAVGSFAVRKDIAKRLGGRLGKRIPYFGETERYAAWEHPDLSTLAEHVARYLQAIGPRAGH